MPTYKINHIKEDSTFLEKRIKNLSSNSVYCYENEYEDWTKPYMIYNDDGDLKDYKNKKVNYFIRLKAEDYPSTILNFFVEEIQSKGLNEIYKISKIEDIKSSIMKTFNLYHGYIHLIPYVQMNTPYIFLIPHNIKYKIDYETIGKIQDDFKNAKDIIKKLENKINSCLDKINKFHDERKLILNEIEDINDKINQGQNANLQNKNLFSLFSKIQTKLINKFSTDNKKKDVLDKKLILIEKQISELNKNKEYLESENRDNLVICNDLQGKINKMNELQKNIEAFISTETNKVNNKLISKYKLFQELRENYESFRNGITSYIKFLLEDSWYSFEFKKNIELYYDEETKQLIVDYLLPKKDDIPNEGMNKKMNEWVKLSETKFRKNYDDIILSIVIRSLAEIFFYDDKKYISSICFNGKTDERSDSTGRIDEKYILSINVSREQIENLNLDYINPKECFKHLKGVSASKLYELTEIKPIIIPQFADKRFIKGKNIEIEDTPNLALMDWEDFEHLVRQIFEWEFSGNGGEVNVTQSSRDGGVDAIVFDPDPIRGGKIIIQAKRYTNTVGVSAVRDLYGTIINEGANKGILITTSDYGSESYKFAQGKPITLLNGGHLLYLLEKHGKKAHINIEEAKKIQTGN